MPKLPKSRLPRYIPLLGIVFFLLVGLAIVFVGSAYDYNALAEGWIFSFIPVLMCIVVARDPGALPWVIVIECVLVGVWVGETIARMNPDLQGATYITSVVGMTVGLALAERARTWLESGDGNPDKDPSSSSAGR